LDPMLRDPPTVGQDRAPLYLAPYYTFGASGWMTPCTQVLKCLPRDPFIKNISKRAKIKKITPTFGALIGCPEMDCYGQYVSPGALAT
jgi:hypothetical protein